ncbi:Cytochrome P450 family protein [Frankia canadensis]|uniref:Cytochrome P450 family protein n=1 Tax=Frankia canadensis TaxID=1836972 RepID=A0A2I2KQ82_9ACTN|nr:cytochrome P450 [Frankia canadensis]SNQ47810.1 Cytochrome P450 family protein [Frankia canadensis]SOU55100.1 Cytochrome P450 family protein [Frankia canadensis]
MDYDPFSPAIAENPYPTYRWMRDNAPVYHNAEHGFYALSRHEDVVDGLLDHATFRNAHGTTLEGVEKGFDTLLTRDPPEHEWNRRILARRFSAVRVQELEPRIREVAAGLLDTAAETGRIDLVDGFAAELPLTIIAELLALPVDQRLRVRDLCFRLLDRAPTDPPGVRPPASVAAGEELARLFLTLVAQRRAEPGDDLISLLVHTPVVDDAGTERFLTDTQLLGRLIELTFAGHETVKKLVSTGAVRLAASPDARRELVDDPSLIPGAVEEMLRIDPPAQYTGRWTSRDVEIHGTVVPAERRVLLLLGSACHDERAHRDPETFDIRRVVGRQLGFGYGIHLCVGAAFARLEARVAFEELLTRYPDYQVDHAGVVRSYSSNQPGLKHLPLILDPAADRQAVSGPA